MKFPFELARFKKIDFFPGRPTDLSAEKRICIGTKSRNLGDALSLTTLPGRLKKSYPGLRVFVYPRAFNPFVFRGNPFVDGFSSLPDAVYGDDCNWGSGNLIRLKEQFFGLRPDPGPVRPEIHLSAAEREWSAQLMKKTMLPRNSGKPLCLLHPRGVTRQSVVPMELWDEVVRRWSDVFRFWQVGVEGHGIVKDCEYYWLPAPSLRSVRNLFALASRASAFIGVDSGPMHVARSFGLPSLILLNHCKGESPEAILERREREPYFLHGNWRFAPLYRENRHFSVPESGAENDFEKKFMETTERFLEAARDQVPAGLAP